MLYLASQSPRRRELLTQAGIEFGLLEVDVPERRLAGEPAEDYVRRVAREKAGAGLLRVLGNPSAQVLGADTEVVLADEVFGKPADAGDARRMLRRLSGRTHQVLTAVWLLDAARETGALSVSEVEFVRLDEDRIDAYLECGEWQGKAGAYAIQGRAAAFVSRLSGSYSGVMGLPLCETVALLRASGRGRANLP
jgi:septum formation protein